jgi:hypothetical protein
MPTALSHRPRTAPRPPPTAAHYRAVLPVGELLFCDHHACQHRTRVLTTGTRLSPVAHPPDPPAQYGGPRP